jgi:hypothetical protein
MTPPSCFACVLVVSSSPLRKSGSWGCRPPGAVRDAKKVRGPLQEVGSIVSIEYVTSKCDNVFLASVEGCMSRTDRLKRQTKGIRVFFAALLTGMSVQRRYSCVYVYGGCGYHPGSCTAVFVLSLAFPLHFALAHLALSSSRSRKSAIANDTREGRSIEHTVHFHIYGCT